MYQKVLFPLIVLLLFSLGLLGQYQLSPENLTDRLSTSVYQILMLFLVSGEWTLELEQIPLAIEIVRFTAPLVSVASLIYVVAANARIAVGNYFLRYYRRHTVVVGLGVESFQFLQTCSKKSAFVVVERNPENKLVARARALGFSVLTQDITQAATCHRLNLSRAESIIVFTESDGENVEVALKLREYLRQNHVRNERSRLHIHLYDVGLAQLLEKFPRFSSDSSATEIYFFSVYDLSARLLLRDYPAEIFCDVAGHDRVHLAIYGYGRLAQKIILEASLLFQFRNRSRLRVTIYDERAEEKSFAFSARYPQLQEVCDVEFVELVHPAAHFSQGVSVADLPTVTQHLICGDVDDDNLEIALRLRQVLLNHSAANAPIFVRMQRSVGLAQLVHTDKGKPEIPDGIYPFGMLDEVLHVDNVLSRRLDRLARAMHDMYVLESEAGSSGQGSTAQSWTQLTQGERKQNLLKADHLPVRLRAIRCVSDRDSGDVVELVEEEAALQAVMEHNRYVGQKIVDGWRFAAQRSTVAKTNPYMLEWDALPADQRDREIADARSLPEYFAKHMGQFVKRRLVIGVTGHRLNKMDVGDTKLQDQIASALAEIKKTYPHHHFTVLSPLAEGADRMVATMAMDTLGAELHVPLPLPYELCQSDFTSQQSELEFQQLVGQAKYCFEMPMKFGDLEKLTGSTEARNKQYALAGAYIAQRCDFLFAIWDGQPEEGVGGTGQVLRWYREGNIAPEFLYRDIYFDSPKKRPALVFEPRLPD